MTVNSLRADADLLADRIDVGEQRLPGVCCRARRPAGDVRLPPGMKRRPDLELREVDRRPVLGGADDRRSAWSSRVRSRCATARCRSRRARRRRARPTGSSRSIARASSIVRFGRRATSRKLLPEAKLSAPHFCTMIVFGPSWLIESRSESSKPRMSDVIPTIDVMPMTTPSTVSAERILLVRSVSSDIATISPSSPARIRRHRLFAPQRFDRIEPRRPHRRIQAEEQPDDRGDADADGDRPELHRRRQRRHLADDQRERRTRGRCRPGRRRSRASPTRSGSAR